VSQVVYIHREKEKWIPIEEKPDRDSGMYLITGTFVDGEEFLEVTDNSPHISAVTYERYGGSVSHYMPVPTPPHITKRIARK